MQKLNALWIIINKLKVVATKLFKNIKDNNDKDTTVKPFTYLLTYHILFNVEAIKLLNIKEIYKIKKLQYQAV